MIALRDVSTFDECTYAMWQNDLNLAGYLNRLCPYNSNVGDYDASRICWFIIEKDASAIGSVWLETSMEEHDSMTLGIFISGEQYRDKGIGRAAIQEAIRISRQRIAFTNVRLNVRKSNFRAIRCYEQCGFYVSGEGQKNASGGAVIDYYTMTMKVGT